MAGATSAAAGGLAMSAGGAMAGVTSAAGGATSTGSPMAGNLFRKTMKKDKARSEEAHLTASA